MLYNCTVYNYFKRNLITEIFQPEIAVEKNARHGIKIFSDNIGSALCTHTHTDTALCTYLHIFYYLYLLLEYVFVLPL